MISRRAKWLWGSGAFITALTAIFLFTTWPRDLLQIPLVVNDAPRQADVIIVLGSGTRREDPYIPPQARQRVIRGIELMLENLAPKMIFSGGLDKKTGIVESEKMYDFAVKQGFNPSQIIMEKNSTSTWTNAQYSRQIMAENKWTKAIVVTSPYHTWRACRMFRKQGADVTCMSADYRLYHVNSVYEKLMDNRSVIREYGAIILAWIKKEL